MTALRIDIYEKQRLVHTLESPSPVELGRQTEGEPAPYSDKRESGRCRLVFAKRDEKEISRRHVALGTLKDDRVHVTNLSKTTPLAILNQREPLQPGGACDIAVPAFLDFGDRKICIQAAGAVPVPPSGTGVMAAEDIPLPHSGAGGSSGGRVGSLGRSALERERDIEVMNMADPVAAPGTRIFRKDKPSLIAPRSTDADSLLRSLQTAMDVLHSAVSSDDFFEKAAQALVDTVTLDSGQVLLLDNSGHWHTKAISLGSDREHDPFHKDDPSLRASRTLLAKVWQAKTTSWGIPKDAVGSLDNVTAFVASPILNRDGNVIGALYGDRQGHIKRGGAGKQELELPITELDAKFVELLASGVATGLARLEQEQANLQSQKKFVQYERELDIGRQIQVGFLPEKLPEDLQGWEIKAYFKPAREVAGDFYDVFKLKDTHYALVMADVCDKGVGAALFMALFRTLIRAYSFSFQTFVELPDVPPDPRKHAVTAPGRRLEGLLTELTVLSTVVRTNRYVADTHAKACMFVTLFMGILDTSTGCLTYVNGGHDAPAILGPPGADGRRIIKTRLQPTGPVVGLMPDSSYEVCNVVLEPGDMLFTFTDGVGDARDPAGKSFTEKHLLALLEQPAPSAAALLDRVEVALREHIGSADQFDDITMLAVRSSK